MNYKNYYVAEYSQSQNKFNYDRLDIAIDNNKKSIRENQPSDWIIIGIFKTDQEAIDFNVDFRKLLVK